MPAAVSVVDFHHRYKEREALRGVSLEIGDGIAFGLLGPNGSGKTTLFRILSTLLPLQQGQAAICGHDVATDPDGVRRQIGVTFQSPSLDIKLTVRENLVHQGHLYGISGTRLRESIDNALTRLSLTDRANDYAETLSGGLKRRVEIAKCLLHSPQVLLLDEPSTGLDPAARHELWQTLDALRRESGMTILVSTHLMEEAERCEQLVILDEGQVIAAGTPDQLRSSVGGDCITLEAVDPDRLASRIAEQFHLTPQRIGGSVRIERERGHEFIGELVQAFSSEFRSITLGKPTLNDVFLRLTGRGLDQDTSTPPAKSRSH